MKKSLATLSLAFMVAALAGCSAPSDDAPTSTQQPPQPATQGETTPPSDAFSIAHITSCDQVEPLVAQYITGLVASERNTVDEYGVTCLWETAEGETDLANVRSVEVILSPVEPRSDKPDTSLIEKTEGGSVIADSWVDGNGGVAYSLTLGTAVAGAIATTVWVPGVEANIAGGAWAGLPALDGPAAVALVKQLLAP